MRAVPVLMDGRDEKGKPALVWVYPSGRIACTISENAFATALMARDAATCPVCVERRIA